MVEPNKLRAQDLKFKKIRPAGGLIDDWSGDVKLEAWSVVKHNFCCQAR